MCSVVDGVFELRLLDGPGVAMAIDLSFSDGTFYSVWLEQGEAEELLDALRPELEEESPVHG